MPSLGMSIAAVDALENILVIGSNLRSEVPLLAHRVRKAAEAGGQVSFINAVDYEYLFPVANSIIGSDADFVPVLVAVVEAAGGSISFELERRQEIGDSHRQLVESLKSGKAGIFLGHMAQRRIR